MGRARGRHRGRIGARVKSDDERLVALVEAARAVRERAYAPYSGFRVGAAVLSAGGTVYTGCNVENASYGATICAERNAIFHMIASGEQQLAAVAIFVDDVGPAMPCGMCRQVVWEFGEDVHVVTATGTRVEHSTIRDLLPNAFVLRRQ
jgi:cytidine deaminase